MPAAPLPCVPSLEISPSPVLLAKPCRDSRAHFTRRDSRLHVHTHGERMRATDLLPNCQTRRRQPDKGRPSMVGGPLPW
ncbi:hypothetical protein ZEAMMB73_Zm00001d002239 [Zea mays]|uniref:Uncharacterized protein n=1 Tax=Zea mays TaxID=4577 RepID=A0A1D6DY63_MAIZE|nr:hypothetical protein ZEAMMB73_Zm00001d002239 [Zea mays]